MTMGDLGNYLGGNESLPLAENFPTFRHALLPCKPSIAQSSLLTELVPHEMAPSSLHGPPRLLMPLYTDLSAVDLSIGPGDGQPRPGAPDTRQYART